MPTRGAGRHWLFIQSENSNRRLHADLKQMMIHVRTSPEEWVLINDCLHIHTIEHDADLSNPDNAREVAGLIADYPSALLSSTRSTHSPSETSTRTRT